MFISIVVPVLNEEKNIPVLYSKIISVIAETYNYEIIFVDDGSTDNSLKIMKEVSLQDKSVHYISFSRNFGHQNALKAGIDHANGDCIITLDADLEHPPGLISDLIDKWKAGFDIVLTKRIYGARASFFKKITSRIFYRSISCLSDIKLEDGLADYRLIDKKIQRILSNSIENDLFIRGYIAWIGYKYTVIEYVSGKRAHGKSGYNFKRMINLALTALTSFSAKPFRWAIISGLAVAFISVILLFVYLGLLLFGNVPFYIWPLFVVLLSFFFGLLISLLGLIGEYMVKVYMQAKGRPLYLIREMDEFLSQRSTGK